IDNVAFHTNESTALAPPTASTSFTNTVANILDQSVLPAFYFDTPGSRYIGTNVFNFERATLRCSEGLTNARVGVIRFGLDYTKSTDVNYHIDFRFANRTFDA